MMKKTRESKSRLNNSKEQPICSQVRLQHITTLDFHTLRMNSSIMPSSLTLQPSRRKQLKFERTMWTKKTFRSTLRIVAWHTTTKARWPLHWLIMMKQLTWMKTTQTTTSIEETSILIRAFSNRHTMISIEQLLWKTHWVSKLVKKSHYWISSNC